MEQKIELKEARDFSETLEATFAFFKQNFKVLAKAILIYIAPLVIINSIVVSAFMLNAGNFFQQIINGTAQVPPVLFISYALSIAIGNLLVCFITIFMKLYADRTDLSENPISLDELWAEVKSKFFKVLGIVLVAGILAGIGFVLFVIPGIWLSISFSVIAMVAVYEDLSIGDAIVRSVQLVKGAWWRVFGLFLVLLVILVVVSTLVSLPSSGLVAAVSLAGMSGDGVSMASRVLLVIVTSFQGVIGQLLSMVLYIAGGLVYFSRVVEKEGAGLYEQVDEINRN